MTSSSTIKEGKQTDTQQPNPVKKLTVTNLVTSKDNDQEYHSISSSVISKQSI